MKIRISSFVVLLLSLLVGLNASAQTSAHSNAATEAVEEEESRTANPRLGEYLKPGTNPNWMDFRPGFTINPQQIFSQYAADFGLTDADEMIYTRTTTDPVGNQHYRFQQFNNGYKVMGAEYIVHVNSAGEIYSANGRLAQGLNHNAQPTKTEGAALAMARGSMPGKTFVPPHWHPTPDEPAFNNPNFMQEGELVWVSADASPQEVQSVRLAWMFDLYEQTGTRNKTVYIDAENGELLRSDKISMGCDYATGTTTWHGNQVAYTNEFAGITYRLEYDCASYGGGGIRSYNNNLDGSIITDYWDSDNTWTDYADRAGYTTHWLSRQVNRYFFLEHNRDNYDDAGGDLTMYTNCSFLDDEGDVYYSNAFYSGNGVCRFGAGGATYDPTDDRNTIDILGHEVTHGVVAESAGLIYQNESGALNESFADIFGTVVEMWTEGTTPDWLIGEDKGGAFRSLQDPTIYGDPNTYEGSNWYFGTDDNGGVHTNSGVQNYWFYLLSEGGTDVNDNGLPYDVSGLGFENAAAIAYGNLTNYLISSSDYTDAREGAIRASNDLFGLCSFESRMTAEAWRACGVGPELVNWDAEAVCGVDYTPFFIDYTVTGIESLTAGGPGCTVTASPGLAGLSVVFRAGEQVRLLPGFRTNPGANFYTLLDPCAATGYRVGSGDEAQEEEAAEMEAASVEKPVVSISPMTVQPNPFMERTTIDLSGLAVELSDKPEVAGLSATSAKISLLVYDQTGKLVKEIHSVALDSGPIVVELSDQPAGVYLCRAQIDGRLVASEKLIKVE